MAGREAGWEETHAYVQEGADRVDAGACSDGHKGWEESHKRKAWRVGVGVRRDGSRTRLWRPG